MSTPRYVGRFARMPRVLETLRAHPNGLPLTELATRVGVDPDELREDLMAFYTADTELLLGLRPDVIEFLGSDGDDEDPNEAQAVRIIDARPAHELGVEYVDAAELALVYTAAIGLHALEPDDRDLEGAIDVLAETMFGAPADEEPAGARPWDWALEPLRKALAERRRVRIVYSRAWLSGVRDRVIEPYRLVQTRRGWEVDAGPADEGDEIRSFLLSNIREADVLDDTFEMPADLADRLVRQRATATVRVRLPHSARWAADMYAEQVRVVEEDEVAATVDLDLLPPLDHRVGILLLAAGPGATVVDPPELGPEGARLAAELLEHHGHLDM